LEFLVRLGIGERPSTATDGSLSIIGRDDRARSDFDKLSDYAEQQGRDRSEIGTDAWASMGDKSSSDVPAGDLCQSVGLTVWAEHGSGDRGGIVVEESGFQVDINAPSAYEAQVRPLMAPFVDVLVNSTVTAGDAVLDVACGTGFATRAAAAVAGRDARVEGSDLNPAMVAHARSVADGSGANLTWREASALELPHEDGEFDTVICQQGLQFFPDPAAGVREMGR
jgi:SAM-dependent methyltransferase